MEVLPPPVHWDVRFSLHSPEVAPAEFTRLAGIEADRTAGKGSKMGRSSLPRPFNWWELCSRLESDADLDDHVADVLGRVERHIDGIGAAVAAARASELRIVGRSAAPSADVRLCLEPDALSVLGQLGASVDFSTRIG